MSIKHTFRYGYDFKNNEERVKTGFLTPEKAIKIHCRECMGWEAPKEDIQSCLHEKCALWPFRMGPEKKHSPGSSKGAKRVVFPEGLNEIVEKERSEAFATKLKKKVDGPKSQKSQ